MVLYISHLCFFQHWSKLKSVYIVTSRQDSVPKLWCPLHIMWEDANAFGELQPVFIADNPMRHCRVFQDQSAWINCLESRNTESTGWSTWNYMNRVLLEKSVCLQHVLLKAERFVAKWQITHHNGSHISQWKLPLKLIRNQPTNPCSWIQS